MSSSDHPTSSLSFPPHPPSHQSLQRRRLVARRMVPGTVGLSFNKAVCPYECAILGKAGRLFQGKGWKHMYSKVQRTMNSRHWAFFEASNAEFGTQKPWERPWASSNSRRLAGKKMCWRRASWTSKTLKSPQALLHSNSHICTKWAQPSTSIDQLPNGRHILLMDGEQTTISLT